LIRVLHYFTEKQIKELKDLQSKTGLSVSEHIRRAVDKYLKEEKDEQTN